MMGVPESPRRRAVLASLASWISTIAAGCLGDDEEDTTDANDGDESSDGIPSFPEIEDPPEVVYTPTHYEGMVMLDPVRAGDAAFGPMLTYPHTFWIVTDDQAELVDPTEDDEVHLMVTPWDSETRTVLPVDAGVTLDIYKDDELITTNNPWLMISQEMGFHFGDNVPLDGDGTYRVEGTVPGLPIERAGSFAERYDDRLTFSFEFTLDRDLREEMVEGVEYLPEEEWGTPGALMPMHHRRGEDSGDDGDSHDDDEADDQDMDSHQIPYSSLPEVEALPGVLQGEPETGDARLVTVTLPAENRFSTEQYVVVSPRTPYNRSVLPMMELEGVLFREDEEQSRRPLVPTLEDEFGYHYGASFPEIRNGDEFEIDVLAPPQVERHQGYETAFLTMPSVTVDIDL